MAPPTTAADDQITLALVEQARWSPSTRDASVPSS
jgi:hypothetical protein